MGETIGILAAPPEETTNSSHDEDLDDPQRKEFVLAVVLLKLELAMRAWTEGTQECPAAGDSALSHRLQPPLRRDHVVLDEQLRPVARYCMVATKEADVVCHAIVVVIQHELQPQLGEPRVGAGLVDVGVAHSRGG